jgi:hypothetical protein
MSGSGRSLATPACRAMSAFPPIVPVADIAGGPFRAITGSEKLYSITGSDQQVRRVFLIVVADGMALMDVWF